MNQAEERLIDPVLRRLCELLECDGATINYGPVPPSIHGKFDSKWIASKPAANEHIRPIES